MLKVNQLTDDEKKERYIELSGLKKRSKSKYFFMLLGWFLFFSPFFKAILL